MLHPFARRRAASIALVLASAVACGCTGAIEDGEGEPPASGTLPPPAPPPAAPPAPGPAMPPPPGEPAAPAPSGPSFECKDPSRLSVSPLRRLSKDEIKNSLNALLGPEIHAVLRPRLDGLPADEIRSAVSDFTNQFSPEHAAVMMEVARLAASTILASNAHRTRLLGACSTAATVTDDCVRSFVRSFGLKVFRRPLTDADVAFFMQLHASSPNPAAGRASVLTALLQSPEFLYHLELGGPGTEPAARFELTPYELASRLSFQIWDSMPDDELFARAADGTLRDPRVLAAQVDRLLASPRARAKIKGFFSFWLDLKRVSGLPSAGPFLQGLDTSGLHDLMLEELDRFVEHVVFAEKGGYRELLTSRRSFATSRRLAALYGHPAPAAPTDVSTFPDHRLGILLRGPVLASGDESTHPILRGVFYRRRILCDPLPSPSPADLVERDAEMIDPDPRKLSTAQYTAARTAARSCMVCHAQINPLGFALEEFDSVGRFRARELVFDPRSGARLAEHALPRGLAPALSPDDATVVDGAAGLVTAIAHGAKGPACFVRQVYRWYHLKEEAAEDACLMQAALEAMQKGGGILAAMRATILNQHLTHRRAQ